MNIMSICRFIKQCFVFNLTNIKTIFIPQDIKLLFDRRYMLNQSNHMEYRSISLLAYQLQQHSPPHYQNCPVAHFPSLCRLQHCNHFPKDISPLLPNLSGLNLSQYINNRKFGHIKLHDIYFVPYLEPTKK